MVRGASCLVPLHQCVKAWTNHSATQTTAVASHVYPSTRYYIPGTMEGEPLNAIPHLVNKLVQNRRLLVEADRSAGRRGGRKNVTETRDGAARPPLPTWSPRKT